MPPQRKYRNREEREVIKQEIIDKLSDIGLPINTTSTFIKLLDEFVVNADNGKFFKGKYQISDLGIEIDYDLQGRRIYPYFARVQKIKQ